MFLDVGIGEKEVIVDRDVIFLVEIQKMLSIQISESEHQGSLVGLSSKNS